MYRVSGPAPPARPAEGGPTARWSTAADTRNQRRRMVPLRAASTMGSIRARLTRGHTAAWPSWSGLLGVLAQLRYGWCSESAPGWRLLSAGSPRTSDPHEHSEAYGLSSRWFCHSTFQVNPWESGPTGIRDCAPHQASDVRGRWSPETNVFVEEFKHRRNYKMSR